MNVLIDRVKLIATVESAEHYKYCLVNLYGLSTEYIGKGKAWWSTKYTKKFKVNLDDENILIVVLGTNGKTNFIKFEFNFHKLSEKGWKTFHFIVGWFFNDGGESGYAIAYENLRVSHVEFAVDFENIKFNQVNVVDRNIKSVNLMYLPNSSVYIGKQHGKREILIYDKKKELAQKHKKYLGHELLRVECRIRDSNLYLKDLQNIKNPFTALVVFDINKEVPFANLGVWVKYQNLVCNEVLNAQQAYLSLSAAEKMAIEVKILLRRFDWWKPDDIWDKHKDWLVLFQPNVLSNFP